MKRLVLLLIAVFLVGCATQKVTTDNNVAGNIIKNETSVLHPNITQKIDSNVLVINSKSQTGGLRVTLDKVYVVQRELYADLNVEKIVKDIYTPKPTEFAAYFYYGSGKLYPLKPCGLNIADEFRWNWTFCASIPKMDDMIFNSRTYLIVSPEDKSEFEGDFLREINATDWTYTYSLNFRDTFIKK